MKLSTNLYYRNLEKNARKPLKNTVFLKKRIEQGIEAGILANNNPNFSIVIERICGHILTSYENICPINEEHLRV